MKAIIQELLESAGIAINGQHPWDIIVHDPKFYNRLMSHPDLALGETYMEGMWDCLRLDQFFYKLFMANLDVKVLKHPEFWLPALRQRFIETTYKVFNIQTKSRSQEVGYKHYDIGNDLYHAMLDKRMVYTCGYWESANNLDAAQEAKLRLSCEKLGLKPGMTLLDIGCGFGSLAKFAAEHYDVSVVGITISRQQYELAKRMCEGLPIEIHFQDYRDLLTTGAKFDRIASLGMFEHVGYKNYSLYMKIVSECLKEDGIFLLHTIGGNISTVTCSSEFINHYIFPHGNVPSITQIGKALENRFVMEDWHNFGPDYDKTLMAWHHNFNRHWESIKLNYDERFRRMWNYYLLSCAASFRSRQNQLWQILLSKTGLAQGFMFNRYDVLTEESRGSKALEGSKDLKDNCRQAS